MTAGRRRPTFAELLAQHPDLAARIERCPADPRAALEGAQQVRPRTLHPGDVSRAALDGHGHSVAVVNEDG